MTEEIQGHNSCMEISRVSLLNSYIRKIVPNKGNSSLNDITTDGDKCFVCGPENNLGLKLVFRLEGDVCRSEFTPSDMHCGYDGVTHGGIIFSVLDDVMAN
jgi:hypothetical protein